ncbi:MAG: ABC transporter substrate-binding protein [Acidimicrobiales bacterium]
MACLASACSGGSDNADAPDCCQSDQEIGVDDGSAPDELASVDPNRVVRLAMRRSDSFDPFDVVLTEQSAVIVGDLLYDGLTEAVGGVGELRPGLAERWQANENFTTWTFHLRPTLLADRGISAEHVVKHLSPLTANTASTKRAGAAAVVAAGLKSVSAVDQNTVVVELLAPNAGLPWVLSGLPFSIVGPSGEPTGDYDVLSDDANGMILRSALGASSSVPRKVELTWTATAAEALEALEAGAVDGAVVDPASFEAASAQFGAVAEATAATRFYVMNSRSATLSDRTARLAVLAALDRNELLSVGFSQPDAEVAVAAVDGLSAETFAGFAADGQCGDVCAFDRVGATRLVADIALPRIDLTYSGADQAAMASAIVAQLSATGFVAEANQLPADDLADVIVTGETDLFGFGWVAPATSIDAVVPPLLTVDSAANIARFDSVLVAQLLAEAAVTGDDQERWALLNAAHRAAMDEALIIPMATSLSMLVRGLGAGWLTVRADGSIDLETIGSLKE